MKYVIVGAFLLLAGCANRVSQAHTAYSNCLSARGVAECQTEKARLNAALAVEASRPPLVFNGYQPPPQQPIYVPQTPTPQRQQVNCVTMGNTISCY